MSEDAQQLADRLNALLAAAGVVGVCAVAKDGGVILQAESAGCAREFAMQLARQLDPELAERILAIAPPPKPG